MENLLIVKIQDVLSELDKQDRYYREKNYNAMDMFEDLDLVQKEQNRTLSNIKIIKSMKTKILELMQECNSFIYDTEIINEEKAIDYCIEEKEKLPEKIVNEENIEDKTNIVEEIIVDKTSIAEELDYSLPDLQKKYNKDINIDSYEVDNNKNISQESIVESTIKKEQSIKTDDENLNIKIYMFGNKIEASSYAQAMISFCKELITRKPYIIAKLPFDNMFGSFFSYSKSNFYGECERLSNGVYVKINLDIKEFEFITSKIIEICGFSKSEIIIK